MQINFEGKEFLIGEDMWDAMTKETQALQTASPSAVALRADFDPEYARCINDNILEKLSKN